MIAKHTVTHLGGDVFHISKEPSDRCVLWGELVKEKERRFLKATLREERIYFSLRDTFEFYIRTVWRPESVNTKGVNHRKGKFALLLHDTVGRLTTSWTWLKLAQPLYQTGISVILVDLPGLGKSSINGVSAFDPSVWQDFEGPILCNLLDELKVPKCHVIACGRSCSALLHMLRHSSRHLERDHIMHNPVLDYNEIFKDSVREPSPGCAGPGWREAMRADQQRELEAALVNGQVRLLATFDEAELGRTGDTRKSFLGDGDNLVLEHTITVVDVTREDVCETQVGADVPVRFLFLRKEVRERFTKSLLHRPLFPVAQAQGPDVRRTLGRRPLSQQAPPGPLQPAHEPAFGTGILTSSAALPVKPVAPLVPAVRGVKQRPAAWSLEEQAQNLGWTPPPTGWGQRAGEPPRAGQQQQPRGRDASAKALPAVGGWVPPATGGQAGRPRTGQLARGGEAAALPSFGWAGIEGPPSPPFSPPFSSQAPRAAHDGRRTPPPGGHALQAIAGAPRQAGAGQQPWYQTAFAAGADWPASPSETSSTSQFRGANTIEFAKQETLARMPGNPHDQRRRILAAMPARTRRNLKAMERDSGEAAEISEAEPVSEHEEMLHVSRALKLSMRSYDAEKVKRSKDEKASRTKYDF